MAQKRMVDVRCAARVETPAIWHELSGSEKTWERWEFDGVCVGMVSRLVESGVRL